MANPTLLSRLLCADADKNTIPDTDAGTAGVFSQQYGWQAINSLPLSAGGKAVQRQDFNGVFNLLGGIAFYAQKGYTFEWDIDQDYYAGCVVTDPLDGKKYNAKNDVAKGGSNPSLDSTNWELFGVVDLSGKANTDLDNLTQAGQDSFLERDFTIIYPNSGTEANPATISVNSSYVEANPFSGYYVACQAEIQYGGDWYPCNQVGITLSSHGYGVDVGQINDGSIKVVTGSAYIAQTPVTRYGGFVDHDITSAPCRVKVWKIGKKP